MKFEDICVSLAMAKRLKEAGWPQDYNSICEWVVMGEDSHIALGVNLPMIAITGREYICAPTASEILDRLPEKEPGEQCKSVGSFLVVTPLQGKWKVSYEEDGVGHIGTVGETLSTAAAAMWLHLTKTL